MHLSKVISNDPDAMAKVEQLQEKSTKTGKQI